MTGLASRVLYSAGPRINAGEKTWASSMSFFTAMALMFDALSAASA